MGATALVGAVTVLGTSTPARAEVDSTGNAAPSESSAEQVGLRLLEAPASAIADPRAQIYIVDHLAPGTSIERRIEISSTASEPTNVELYSAAATIDGTSFTGAPGRQANHLSSWTTIDRASIDVPPDGTAIATVSIDIPADAAPGEQYAVVWAEVRAKPEDSSGIAQVSRVGIRLYISIGPGGAPAADFAIDSLAAGRSAYGAPMVTAHVTNTGGRALDMTGTLRLLDGPGALQAGPFTVSVGTTLAIGDTEPVVVRLDPSVPAGPWTARVELRSGHLERSGEATITFPDANTAAPVPIEPPPRTPVLLVLAVSTLLALVIAGLLWRRHVLQRVSTTSIKRWRWSKS